MKGFKLLIVAASAAAAMVVGLGAQAGSPSREPVAAEVGEF